MKRIIMSTVMVIIGFVAVIAIAGNPCPKKIGICVPGAATDKAWNEQGVVGLHKVATKYGFEVVLAESLGYGDIKPTMRDMVAKGCELIITHAAGYQVVAPEIARETGVKVVTCLNPKEITPGLISDFNFQSGGGGYLAGVLAGRMTRSNVVGIVAAAEPSNFNRLSAGFACGLKATNPQAKLLHSIVGPQSYDDAAGGKHNTADQIAFGADVIFGLGDGASFGMLQACSSKKAKDGGKVWFIDVIGDKRDSDNAGVLLSSVQFDFSVVYEEIVESIIDGSFGKQHWVSFPSGAIYLLAMNPAVPEEVRQELQTVRRGLISGEIDVVDIPVAADLHRYIKKLGW